MIQEDYVNFEQAKLLKAKGFHELCHYETHAYYLDSNLAYHHKEKDFNNEEYSGLTTQWYSRPTLSAVQKWFRKEKNINIDIQSNFDTVHKYWYYGCSIWNTNGKLYDQLNSFSLPEEALSVGINKALELL